MKIESKPQDIVTLLSSGFYRIPPFQRPYSWDRENVQDFWNDAVQENRGDYFIGSMVVYKDGKQSFGIVDGQQRLTTITILLCAFRKVCDREGFKSLAGGIHQLVERQTIEDKKEFVLLTDTSYPYFQQYIQKRGTSDVSVDMLKEEVYLREAHELLCKQLDDVVKSLRGDSSLTQEAKTQALATKLKQIRDAVLELKLILIQLDDEDDAYLIFETLNTRGKDLSVSDLVKNYLTKYLKDRNVKSDQVKVKWGQIVKTIQSSEARLETDTFIHHFWLSRYEYLPMKSLFKQLKRDIPASKTKDFLNELQGDSVLYRTIHEPGFRKWKKHERRIRESLDALNLFRVRQQTPCVLSLIRKYNAGEINKRQVEDALVVIEKFHFLFTAVTSSRSSGGISAMYASLARRLSETRTAQAAGRIIRELKAKLKERVPSLEEVVALMPEIVYTANITKQRELIRYALTGFRRAANRMECPDYGSMEIEHLVPQSMIGRDGYDDKLIGQLGNLILVAPELNRKLSNKPFKEKKEILLAENYPLRGEIRDAKEWGRVEIEKLTKTLTVEAYKDVWHI